MLTDLKNIWTFGDMVFELTHRELRGKYKDSVLGFIVVWAVKKRCLGQQKRPLKKL